MFMVDLEYQNSELMPKFDNSQFEITKLLPLDNEYNIAYSDISKYEF